MRSRRVRGSGRRAVAQAARADSTSARSCQGAGPVGPMIERSWPLPANRTTSPGRACSSAAAMAARRSGIRNRSRPWRLPAASAPRPIASMIASRSSPRGSSSVTITSRQRSPAMLAHHRALVAVALPCRAEDRDQPAAAGRRDRREQVEDRVERGRAMGVVDDHGERLAAFDPLHPARDPGHALEARADDRGSRPRPSPRATTARALWTLNRPASWSEIRLAPDGAA